MRLLFLIDVTQESFNKGFLEGFCEGILGALYGDDELPGIAATDDSAQEGEKSTRRLPLGAKVGILTFDKEVHFYNLHVGRPFLCPKLSLTLKQPSNEKAQMMVMPDIDDPFVPLSEGLFVDPYEAKYGFDGSSNSF